MANEHTVTTAANFLPEIWSNEIQKFAQSRLVAAKRVKRFDSQVKGKGDILHIPKIAEITATAKSASTDVVPTANTEGVVNLNLDKHYYAAVDIEDIVKVQSAYDLMEAYTQPLGYAIAKQTDTDLLSLESGLSQSVGSATATMNEALILSGIVLLDDADAPEDDRHFIIKPAAKQDLLAVDNFTTWQDTGIQQPAVVTGRLGEIFGVEVAVSTNVQTSGSPSTNRNVLFHRECFALAMQTSPRVQADYELRGLSTLMVVDSIYGVVEYRDGFGAVVIN